ncbi:RagB/SusD family nutrient uptake outer membrane protein [Pseudopedobacter beijingensis]|uniref:RagB/SusD family nutrient uptake outer membrane protein n=1 Tax=Pseudopedobacter beijingensis TaxID=1207056 RepID=A0ABW4I7S4_9SPHI
MKYYIKAFGLICLLNSIASCNKFIDTKPEDYLTSTNYYTTETQVKYALNAIYSTLAHYTLYGREMQRMGLDGEDGFYNVVNTYDGVKVYVVPSVDPNVADFWSTCYTGIYRANLLLANIDKPQSISKESRDAIKGETLFLRSYFYFLLVSNFGDVPYVTEPTQQVRVPRTPASQVYKEIIVDMEKAEELVLSASQVGFGGRINKSAVRGVLARVNLFRAGYPVYDSEGYREAKKWAEKVINDQEAAHALNPSFEQVFINYSADLYDIKESIWEIEYWGNNRGTFKEGGQIGAYNGIRYTGADANYGYSLGMVNGTGVLWKKYDSPASLTSRDLRRDWTMAPFSVSGNPAVETNRTINEIYQRNCGKYRRKYEVVTPKDNQYTPINFPVLRYADVLLMLAEAENEINGPTPEAYDAINLVRRRGFGKLLSGSVNINEFDLSGLDQKSFREELQDERSRELSFECLRKGDLVRWNLFGVNMEKALKNAQDSGLPSSMDHAIRYFKNVSPRDIVWPVPAYEIGVNRELTQNIGW